MIEGDKFDQYLPFEDFIVTPICRRDTTTVSTGTFCHITIEGGTGTLTRIYEMKNKTIF